MDVDIWAELIVCYIFSTNEMKAYANSQKCIYCSIEGYTTHDRPIFLLTSSRAKIEKFFIYRK